MHSSRTSMVRHVSAAWQRCLRRTGVGNRHSGAHAAASPYGSPEFQNIAAVDPGKSEMSNPSPTLCHGRGPVGANVILHVSLTRWAITARGGIGMEDSKLIQHPHQGNNMHVQQPKGPDAISPRLAPRVRSLQSGNFIARQDRAISAERCRRSSQRERSQECGRVHATPTSVPRVKWFFFCNFNPIKRIS